MTCNSANAKCLGMKADRVLLSGVSIDGYSVTTATPSFAPTDVGKTLVVYDSVWVDWNTYYTTGGPVSDTSGLPTASSGNNGAVYEVGSGPQYQFYRSNGAYWTLLKYREARAAVIVAYISATEVEVDYEFDSLTDLTVVMGTDNYYSLQHAVDNCIENQLTLTIPDGDYLIVFSDVYSTIGQENSKQGIRLYSGTLSNIVIQGESNTNTRLFFEAEQEIVKPVMGLMIYNSSPNNYYKAVIETLQIQGPSYKPKFLDLTDDISFSAPGAPNFSACYSYGMNSFFEANDLIINGNSGLNIGITMTGGSFVYDRRGYCFVNNCVINNCSTIALGEFGDLAVMEIQSTVINRIGYDGKDTYTGRDYGTGFYGHLGNSYSFVDCTFENIPRHFIGLTRGEGTDLTPYYYPGNPILYQELINCKVINSGSMNTDRTFPLTKISGCTFNNIAGINVANHCFIENCTFSYCISMMEPNYIASAGTTTSIIKIPTVPAAGVPTINLIVIGNGISPDTKITSVSAPALPWATPPPDLDETELTLSIPTTGFGSNVPIIVAPASQGALFGHTATTYPDNMTYEIIISNCSFYHVSVLSMGEVETAGVRSRFHYKFNNCMFEGNGLGTLFSSVNGGGEKNCNRLDVINCSFVSYTDFLLGLTDFNEAYFKGNTLDNRSAYYFQRVFMIYSEDAKLTLIDNYIPQTLGFVLEINPDFTKGGQVKGYNNYIAHNAGIRNYPALEDPILVQELIGSSGNYPEIISLSVSDDVLTEVNFNYDFYKIIRDGSSIGTPVELTGIAFSTGASLSGSWRGAYTGSIRIMPIHDPNTQGDIILKNSGGVMSNGNIMLKSFLFPTGTLNTNTTITDVSSTAGIVIGMPITGTDIPSGTTVTGFTADTITISNAATGSGSVELTINTGGDYTVIPYQMLEFYYDTSKQMWYLTK